MSVEMPGMEAHTFYPSTGEAEAGESELEASLAYVAGSKPPRATCWGPVLKTKSMEA